MKVNFTKGVKRIYFLLSALWIIMVLFGADFGHESVSTIHVLLTAFLPPIIIYFLIIFILDGFKD